MRWRKASTALFAVAFLICLSSSPSGAATKDYERARWDPIHFKPMIDSATNDQCLACHQEVLTEKVLEQSPAGVKASQAKAWYQTLSTYKGAQEPLHKRHLSSEYSQQVMDLKCNFCHTGFDPRETTPVPPTNSSAEAGYTMRKNVNPETTCLKCHGAFPEAEIMGLPGKWSEVGKDMGNCVTACHENFRVNRHKVTYLKADNIEKLGKEDTNVCYGCHGGRAWYRISFPYPRNPSPEMDANVPDWAKNRPTQSEERYRLK